MSDISVTQILKRLRDGGQDDREVAAAQLYQRFHGKVEKIARGRLSTSGGLSDEEDVAQSAFRSFFGRIDTGQLDELVSGGQAWAVLARLTHNKAIDSVRYNQAMSRGGAGARPNSPEQTASRQSPTTRLGLAGGKLSSSNGTRAQKPRPLPLEAVADQTQRTAEDQAVSHETLAIFLEQLSEATLRGIVALKLEGFTNDEIAEKLGCATRTV